MSAQPQFAIIPVQLLDQVAQYLAQRPYIEVAQLIGGLGQLQAVEMTPPPTAPAPEVAQPAGASTDAKKKKLLGENYGASRQKRKAA